ncbi:MAG: hypothetical protein R3F49_06235 [Planctomycetota bacterium]
MSGASIAPAAPRAARAAFGLAALLGLAALAAYGWTLRLELLGWDSYPLIAAARVDSFAALLRTLTDELMGGRYPDGHFYRPVTQLSFALDRALGGLRPAAYARTDLALGALAALMVALVTRRLTGGAMGSGVTGSGVTGSGVTGSGATGNGATGSGAGGFVGALLAGLVFLLHPAQLEVLPYAPRRADTLAIVFTLATLLSLGRAHGAWTGALALCALSSKETGVIVAPLALGWAWLIEGGGQPFKGALMRCAPIGLALLAALAARFAVLGGLGGHPESGLGALSALGETSRTLVGLVTASSSAGGAMLGAVVLALGVAALWSGDSRRLAWLALAALSAWAITVSAGRAHGWYALLLVVPVAAFAGLVVARALDALRGARQQGALARAFAAPLAGVATLALAITLAARGGAHSPDPAFDRASRLARATLTQLDAALATARPGARAVLRPWAPLVEARSGPVFIHAPYSLVAYAQCVAPTLEVQALVPDAGAPPPLDPARWQLVLAP